MFTITVKMDLCYLTSYGDIECDAKRLTLKPVVSDLDPPLTSCVMLGKVFNSLSTLSCYPLSGIKSISKGHCED